MSKLAEDARKYWNVQTFCLLTLTLIALGVALSLLRTVLVPFVLAVFLTHCLIPVIDAQRRYLRLPKGVAIAATALLSAVLIALCGSLVAGSVSSASHRLADYETQFQHFTESMARSVPLARFGVEVDAEQIARFFTIQEGTGWQFISAALGEAANVLSGGVIVMIFMLFLLLSSRGGADGQRPSGMLGEIETSVQRYIVTTVLLSLATALLVGLSLAVLGVELAWIFAFLTFLLNFVPSIGAIIASLLPLPVILLSPELSMTAKVSAIVIPALIQFLVGSFIQPKVQGSALALHPVVVLLALMFFGMIWGISGAFLAAPITAVVRIICARIPVTRPLADVLAGNLRVLAAEDRGTAAAERTRLA